LSLDPVTITEGDLEQWDEVLFPVNMRESFHYTGTEANFYFGLFGWDTTDFLADCLIATDYCDYDTNSTNYDGWAIGSYWLMDPEYISLPTYIWAWEYGGFCLDDGSCFGIFLDLDTSDYEFYSNNFYAYVSEVTITETEAPEDYNKFGTYWVVTEDNYYYGYGFNSGYFFAMLAVTDIFPYNELFYRF